MRGRERDSSGKAFRLMLGRREDGGRRRGGHGASLTGSKLGEERGLTRRAPAQRPGVPPGAEVARPRTPASPAHRSLPGKSAAPTQMPQQVPKRSETGGCPVALPAVADSLSKGDPSSVPRRLPYVPKLRRGLALWCGEPST